MTSPNPIVTPDDLKLYLDEDDAAFKPERAQLLLDLTIDLCQSVPGVPTPLPVAARAVVLDVAQRAYTNPKSMSGKANTTGPFSSSETYFAASNGPRAQAGGLWLTSSNLESLLALVKSPRAVSVDMTAGPMYAVPCPPYWPWWADE